MSKSKKNAPITEKVPELLHSNVPSSLVADLEKIGLKSSLFASFFKAIAKYYIQNPNTAHDYSDYALFFSNLLTFKLADELAGRPKNSYKRVAALFCYATSLLSDESGSTYNHELSIRKKINQLENRKAEIPPLVLEQAISWALSSGFLYEKSIVSPYGKAHRHFCTLFNHTLEIKIASAIKAKLNSINIPKSDFSSVVEQTLLNWETNSDFTLAPCQRQAVLQGITMPISIITGPPGSGKTSVLNAMCDTIQRVHPNSNIVLCAPTGKAAIRMTEATNRDATTIHRQLSIATETKGSIDFLIIDEATMVSLRLLHLLLETLTVKRGIIFVGDINQLPPIGAGQAFADMISSGIVPTTVLDCQFRQGKGSLIPSIANQLLDVKGSGKNPIPENASPLSQVCLYSYNFYENQVCRSCRDVEKTVFEMIQALLRDGVRTHDIQILVPTKISRDRINKLVRRLQNPTYSSSTSSDDDDYDNDNPFWPNDRVMNTWNNFKAGVMNGEIGYVEEVTYEGIIARFGTRLIAYKGSELDNVDLAYAITIHKSQGSEYPHVILPLSMEMESSDHDLLYRNMLYTAFTRAKKSVIAIGTAATFEYAMRPAKPRTTALCEYLSACNPFELPPETPVIPLTSVIETMEQLSLFED